LLFIIKQNEQGQSGIFDTLAGNFYPSISDPAMKQEEMSAKQNEWNP
jgi:hypothetical protein